MSRAMMFPGRAIWEDSGKSSLSSGRSGPFGSSSKLVVRMVGSSNYLAGSAVSGISAGLHGPRELPS